MAPQPQLGGLLGVAAPDSAPPAAHAAPFHPVPERWRPGYLFGVAAQPDGPLLGAACSDGRLRLWARQGGDGSIHPLCTLPWNQVGRASLPSPGQPSPNLPPITSCSPLQGRLCCGARTAP